jgi:S1-C subfamily serine protease
MNTKKTLIRFAAFAVILFVAGSGAALAFAQSQSSPAPVAATSNTIPAAVVSNAPLTSLSTLQNSFETVYDKVNPSVVNIQVVEQSSGSSFGGGFGFNNPVSAVPQQALGSGFVWDTAGHIVTNNHVVAGATSITVTFWDGTVATAKLVGADPNSDLAVIQVNVPASKLVPIQLADSSKAQVGQIVIAIGNPYGLQGTMTQGIISGLSRSLPVGLDNQTAQQGPTYSIPDIIQTDAAINPGNSGGVLVDSQGNLIGVTAAMESQSGSSSGIGFVIPSSIVAKVVPALINTGTYHHPSLGFSSTDLTPEIAQAMNLPQSQQGALIVDVTPGGPAENAGLQGSTQAVMINGQQTPIGGDIVTAINGQPVKNSDELSAYVFDNTQVGQTVTLTILRNGHEQSVKVTMGILPAQ